MKYRTSLLFPAEDLGASGTKVIDIDVSKPISRLEFTYKVTRGSNLMAAGAPACISRIELVDGARRLHTTTGYENQALAYYSYPGVNMEHGQHVSTLSEVSTYFLSFGRHLWDDQLAFDPSRFSNPQLRITYNEVASDASGGAGTLEVWAHIFDEKEISPLGFLAAIEHYDYTCGADNSYETIELPEDRVIRQILVRAFYQGYEPWYNIDEARFDEGTLDKIAWEYTDLEMYYRRMKSVWPLITQQVVTAPGASGNTFYVPTTDYNMAASFIGMGGSEEAYYTNASARGGYMALTTSTGVNLAMIIAGYLPWHCYQFPMGMMDVIDDWYNPAGKKPRLRLRASTGATNATGQVVLEELYRY